MIHFIYTTHLLHVSFHALVHPTIAGAVPSSFGSLQNLKELNLQKNFFTSLPTQLFQLEYLEYLIADYNKFTGKFPDGITQMASLVEVHLAYNRE